MAEDDIRLELPGDYFATLIAPGTLPTTAVLRWWEHIPAQQEDCVGVLLSPYPRDRRRVFMNSGVLEVFPGWGAPQVAWTIEVLAARGVTTMIGLAPAESTSAEDLRGITFVPTEAFFGESVARTYHDDAPQSTGFFTAALPRAHPYPSARLIEGLGLKGRQPKIWSSETPMLRTQASMKEARLAGARIMDMDTAAAFAVSERLGVQYAQVSFCAHRFPHDLYPRILEVAQQIEQAACESTIPI